jgi:hypothetical protein
VKICRGGSLIIIRMRHLQCGRALVYDHDPPTDWPHHQVSGHVLNRKLPDPQDAMKFWVATDRSGKSLQDLEE